MAKTASITLGGNTYVVKAFTLDDMEEIGSIIGDGKVDGSVSVKIIKIALRNADPPISGPTGRVHIDSLEELTTATSEIMKLAGLEMKTENPTEAAPVAAA